MLMALRAFRVDTPWYPGDISVNAATSAASRWGRKFARIPYDAESLSVLRPVGTLEIQALPKQPPVVITRERQRGVKTPYTAEWYAAINRWREFPRAIPCNYNDKRRND